MTTSCSTYMLPPVTRVLSFLIFVLQPPRRSELGAVRVVWLLVLWRTGPWGFRGIFSFVPPTPPPLRARGGLEISPLVPRRRPVVRFTDEFPPLSRWGFSRWIDEFFRFQHASSPPLAGDVSCACLFLLSRIHFRSCHWGFGGSFCV